MLIYGDNMLLENNKKRRKSKCGCLLDNRRFNYIPQLGADLECMTRFGGSLLTLINV